MVQADAGSLDACGGAALAGQGAPARWSGRLQFVPPLSISSQATLPVPRTPKGFAVIDGVIPLEVAAALRAEIDVLRSSPDGLVRENCTHLVHPDSGVPELLPKANIYEAEISLDARARAAAPLLAQVRGVVCCAVLCCAVLCCAVLCCAVLCCAVLCCAVLLL